MFSSMHDLGLQWIDFLQVHLFTGLAHVGLQRLDQIRFMPQNSLPKGIEPRAPFRGGQVELCSSFLLIKDALDVFHAAVVGQL